MRFLRNMFLGGNARRKAWCCSTGPPKKSQSSVPMKGRESQGLGDVNPKLAVSGAAREGMLWIPCALMLRGSAEVVAALRILWSGASEAVAT